MNLNRWQIISVVALLGVYSLLFYLIITHQYRIDFSSFYYAGQALRAGTNPYHIASELPININPPVTLWLMSPLTRLGYNQAEILWTVVIFILGLLGAWLTFYYAFSPEFLKKYGLNLFIICLSSFFFIMNTAMIQLGSVVLFFVMLGYHFYARNNDCLAGCIWGVIIAVKLFPALLFFYVLCEKRYYVALTMGGVLVLVNLLMILEQGLGLYAHYFSLVDKAMWYGANWNASIYGYLYRLLIDTSHPAQHLGLMRGLYGITFILLFVGYWYRLSWQVKQSSLAAFSLTLVMMLLLSPLGWVYYFPLLLLPLALTWANVCEGVKGSWINYQLIGWFLTLFLLNFPIAYVTANLMGSFLGKVSLFSLHFYGLLLLMYQSAKINRIERDNVAVCPINFVYSPIYVVIFSFGMLVVIIRMVSIAFGGVDHSF